MMVIPTESLLTSIKNELIYRKLEDYRKNPFAVIYHMGKVGSTSTVLSLLHNKYPAHHCQWVSEETVAFFNYFQSAPIPTSAALHNKQTEYFRAMFADRDFARHIKIISIVRDPVANILSHIFHNMPALLNAVRAVDAEHVDPKKCCETICRLSNKFLDYRDLSLTEFVNAVKGSTMEEGLGEIAVFFYMMRNPLHFFDEEIKKYVGVNVYDYPFPKGEEFPAERKFQYCDNVLVFRFEEISQIAENLIADYLQIQRFEMLKSNVGEEKEGGDLYREVKNTIRFPSEFLDYVYSSKYANHFYSSSEIATFRSRWS